MYFMSKEYVIFHTHYIYVMAYVMSHYKYVLYNKKSYKKLKTLDLLSFSDGKKSLTSMNVKNV